MYSLEEAIKLMDVLNNQSVSAPVFVMIEGYIFRRKSIIAIRTHQGGLYVHTKKNGTITINLPDISKNETSVVKKSTTHPQKKSLKRQ